jgi:hypothetical protein
MNNCVMKTKAKSTCPPKVFTYLGTAYYRDRSTDGGRARQPYLAYGNLSKAKTRTRLPSHRKRQPLVDWFRRMCFPPFSVSFAPSTPVPIQLNSVRPAKYPQNDQRLRAASRKELVSTSRIQPPRPCGSTNRHEPTICARVESDSSILVFGTRWNNHVQRPWTTIARPARCCAGAFRPRHIFTSNLKSMIVGHDREAWSMIVSQESK